MFPPCVARMTDVHRRCGFLHERWTVVLLFYTHGKGPAPPTVSKQWIMNNHHIAKFLRSAQTISTAVAERTHYPWIFPGGSWNIEDVEVLLWPPGTFVFSAIQAYAEYKAHVMPHVLPMEDGWFSALYTPAGVRLAGAARRALRA